MAVASNCVYCVQGIWCRSASYCWTFYHSSIRDGCQLAWNSW